MAIDDLPMRTPLPRLVFARLRAEGIDADGWIERFALPPEVEREATIVAPVDTLARFYDEAAIALREPDLGLSLATAIPRGAYGLFEFGVRAESTLRGALERLCKTMALFNRVAQLDWSVMGDSVRVEMAVPGRAHAMGRHANEFFVALLVSWARALVDGDVVIDRVWFCHARPSSIDAHARVLGCASLEFDASGNEVSVRTIAKRLGHSPRSLQRHLGASGTSFRQVLDEVRRDRVRELQREGVTTEEIAARLGYRDLGAFRRALRRWA